VHVLGRRSPAHATWTTKELRELGEFDGIDVVVDPASLELEPASLAHAESDRVVARNVEVIREWSQSSERQGRKSIHLHFRARPVEIRGANRVEQVIVERTTVDDSGSAAGTGETFTIPAQLIIRSVGYRGTPIDDVPFDSRRNVIPNDEGRVLPDTGVPIKGLYVAGWIKRGPSGIIGTNKKDAAATVASLLLDLADETPKGGDGIISLLASRGIEPIGYEGWTRIDAAEQALGAAQGRDRTTLHTTQELRAAAAG
jgi:ferredoxin--NADP+ reductase